MQFAFLVIADRNGVRRVPIGFIDSDSRVISLELGQPPIATSPPPVARLERLPGIGSVLITVALSLLIWKYAGAWGLLCFSLLGTYLAKVIGQAWSITQQRQRTAQEVPGRDLSPSAVR